MLINCQFDAAKVASNAKRHKFACKKLESIEPNYGKIMHFKKIPRYIELEILAIELFIIVLLFETINFRII